MKRSRLAIIGSGLTAIGLALLCAPPARAQGSDNAAASKGPQNALAQLKAAGKNAPLTILPASTLVDRPAGRQGRDIDCRYRHPCCRGSCRGRIFRR